MAITSIDIKVDDIPAALALLRDGFGWEVTYDDPNFASLRSGSLEVMLSREAMVPWGDADGVIIHDEVEDVEAAAERARNAGAEPLLGPLTTDWGTRSAMFRGPGRLIVDLYVQRPR